MRDWSLLRQQRNTSLGHVHWWWELGKQRRRRWAVLQRHLLRRGNEQSTRYMHLFSSDTNDKLLLECCVPTKASGDALQRPLALPRCFAQARPLTVPAQQTATKVTVSVLFGSLVSKKAEFVPNKSHERSSLLPVLSPSPQISASVIQIRLVCFEYNLCQCEQSQLQIRLKKTVNPSLPCGVLIPSAHRSIAGFVSGRTLLPRRGDIANRLSIGNL